MRRTSPSLLLAGLLFAWPLAATAQADEPSVVVVKVDGSIDRTLGGYLRDALREAEVAGSTVVLQLDSAGTLDQDAVALARRVHDATVPVIVWVGPSPAKAQGAGLLLLLAASVGAVAPGAGVGPLAPLDLAGADEPPPAAVRRLVDSWAGERGRLAPVSVPDHPVPAQQALDDGIALYAAASVTDLLEQLDGTTAGTAGGEVTLRTRIARVEGESPVEVRFVDLGPVARVLHAASSPTWIYVLLVLGLAGLAFEVTQPGFGFAGFAGVAMVALAVYGLTVVPFSWVGLLALTLGVGLMTLDVRVRKLGPLTALGLAAFVTGSVVVFGGVADQIDVSPWLIGSSGVAALLFWGFGLTVAVQSRDRITSTQQGLVGLVGEARGELSPEGPVYVKGTLWRGRGMNGPIEAGTRIRVRAVDGLILRVQAEPEDPTPGDAPSTPGPGAPPDPPAGPDPSG
jgi:membrane-bound serine protease (ClpP class)